MTPNFQLFSSLRYDPLLEKIALNTEFWVDDKPPMSTPFYMLPFHRDRMLQAADQFGWKEAGDAIRGPEGLKNLHSKLVEAVASSPVPLRVRTVLDHDGTISIEKSEAAVVTEQTLYPARLPPPKGAKKLTVSPLTGGALELGEGDSVHGDPPTNNPWIIVPDTTKTAPSLYTSYKTTSRDMYTLARERTHIMDFAEKKEVLIISEKDGEIMEGSLTSPYLWRNGKWTTPPTPSGGQIGTTRRWALQKGLCAEGVITVDSLVDGEECWISNGVRGFQSGRVKL